MCYTGNPLRLIQSEQTDGRESQYQIFSAALGAFHLFG